MQTTLLGNTGLTVSVAGLGCGGNSRLGLGRGASHDECVSLVRQAIDSGVNFLDTAESYGTEAIVGDAMRGAGRDAAVISTKTRILHNKARLTSQQVIERIDASLGQLQTDYIDIFHLHAVLPHDYDYALTELAPVLVKAREAGKIRHIGITESSPRDPLQQTLERAIHDSPWEVMMLGFNMMNQGARREILPAAISRGIGTLIMFAVRNVFSQPEILRATLAELASAGKIPVALADASDPLGELVNEAGASSVTDAAYRYVRHQPGANVILFGTGSTEHLAMNIESINKPPLNESAVTYLHDTFAKLTGVGLVLPDTKKA